MAVHFLIEGTPNRGACGMPAPRRITTDDAGVTCKRCAKARAEVTAESEVGVRYGWSREEFVAFLRGTLIPDLRESGMEFTADDFETACAFIEDPTLRAVSR